MRGRRRRTGGTSTTAIARPAQSAAATAITIMIVGRNWGWWGGGSEQPDHLFRWDWLLFAGSIVARRRGHRSATATAARNVRRRAHVWRGRWLVATAFRASATAAATTAWCRCSASRVVVIVRRMRPIDDRVRSAGRWVVETGAAAKRTGAILGWGEWERGKLRLKIIGSVGGTGAPRANAPVSNASVAVRPDHVLRLEAVGPDVRCAGRRRMVVLGTVRRMIAAAAPTRRAQVAQFRVVVAGAHRRQGVSATRGAP